jgi:NAD-dependent dihydropyrimidine dehydrogenase PreA subunit
MRTTTLKWIPVVNMSLCTGCNRCLEVCEQCTLTLRDGVAVVAWPDRCQSDAKCVTACLEGAMHMEWASLEGDQTRGRWAFGGRVWPGRVRGRRELRVG